MRAFRPSAEAGQVVLETSRSKNISQVSPFSSAANTHVKRQHRSGTRTDSTAFPQAGALVWTTTEVLNTPAAAAALPALADRAMALATRLREVLLGLCCTSSSHCVFPCSEVCQCGVIVHRGNTCHVGMGLHAPGPARPSEFYRGSQAKKINAGLLP